MVTKGGCIVPHGAHHPQLNSLRCISSLEQRAHGKVTCIHQNSVREFLFLRIDGSHQPGITAIALPFLIGCRQKVGVKIVRKEHCCQSITAVRKGRSSGAEEKNQHANAADYTSYLFHLFSSDS